VFNGGQIILPGPMSSFYSKESPASKRLRELRQAHPDTHFFYAVGNIINCVPVAPGSEQIGEPKTFNIFDDFQLANALARFALLEFFKQANQTIVRTRPVTIQLEQHNLATARPDVFGIFPEYELDVRPLAPHEGRITSGVLVGFSVRQQFLKTVLELFEEGVQPSGLYVVYSPEDNPEEGPQWRRYLGKVDGISDGIVSLSDSDVARFDADKCYLEGSRLNVESVARGLLGEKYKEFSTSLLRHTHSVMGAEAQIQRLAKLASWFEEKSPLKCCEGLSVRIAKEPQDCPRGTDAGLSHLFAPPTCVLRPGGSITVPWPIDKQIDQHGPYDTESFPDKRVRIAVITPEEFAGEVGQFLRQFKDGVGATDDRTPFRQGFLRKYHLHSCDFTFHEVKRSASLDESYRTATFEALKTKAHLAVVIIREQYRDLPDVSNPYYTSKARIMAQGVPVQTLEIETIRAPGRPFILNNLSVAVYAKLGGIPWTLTPNQDLAHEIIVGIGSARLNESRRGTGERVVGITTVFSGDGQYLLANNTQEVSSDQYVDALTASLQNTVSELRSRFGWRSRDRVRFIFHQTFKKYKDLEAEAVGNFINALGDFDVQYAFVHVSDSHNWMLVDPSVRGVKIGTSVKGAMVPQRGQCVPLGPHTALLTLTGPYQIKNSLQGCPHPVLINIHQSSTFTSVDYLARQIFNLSFMSWRGFSPSTLPVSISYSNMIVDLLSHLRHVKNWNPDTLATALRERQWFL
jgi:hypothetical protein